MDLRIPCGLASFLVAVVLVVVVSPGAQGSGDYKVWCYNFTWAGENVSVICDDHKTDELNEGQPCLSTLVYTIPPTSPPNISDLNHQCNNVKWCPPYKCYDSSCVRQNWYDVTGKMVNYSAFCGKIIDKTDPSNPKEMQNQCFEMQVGTHKKETCVCNSPLCNAASSLHGGPTVLLTVAATVLLSMALSPSCSSRP